MAFKKATIVYHLKEENIGGHSPSSLGYSPLFEICQKYPKFSVIATF